MDKNLLFSCAEKIENNITGIIVKKKIDIQE